MQAGLVYDIFCDVIRCVLAVLGVPKPSARSGMQAPSMRYLAGKRIATAFPVAAEKCFLPYETEATGKTKIECANGTDETAIPVIPALEAASICRHGLADAIVDLVELDANGEPIPTPGFKVVHLIQHSQAILVRSESPPYHGPNTQVAQARRELLTCIGEATTAIRRVASEASQVRVKREATSMRPSLDACTC